MTMKTMKKRPSERRRPTRCGRAVYDGPVEVCRRTSSAVRWATLELRQRGGCPQACSAAARAEAMSSAVSTSPERERRTAQQTKRSRKAAKENSARHAAFARVGDTRAAILGGAAPRGQCRAKRAERELGERRPAATLPAFFEGVTLEIGVLPRWRRRRPASRFRSLCS